MPAKAPRARRTEAGGLAFADLVQEQGLDAGQRTFAAALEVVLDDIVQTAVRLLKKRQRLQERLADRSIRSFLRFDHHHCNHHSTFVVV